MLNVNNIEVIYDHVILVLKGVSLEVPEKGIVALLGANGAGKTTFIRMVTGFLLPSSGSVRVHGVSPAAHPSRVHRQLGVDSPPGVQIRRGGQGREGRQVFQQCHGA